MVDDSDIFQELFSSDLLQSIPSSNEDEIPDSLEANESYSVESTYNPIGKPSTLGSTTMTDLLFESELNSVDFGAGGIEESSTLGSTTMTDLPFESELNSIFSDVQQKLDELCHNHLLELDSTERSQLNSLFLKKTQEMLLKKRSAMVQYDDFVGMDPIEQMESPRSGFVEGTTLDLRNDFGYEGANHQPFDNDMTNLSYGSTQTSQHFLFDQGVIDNGTTTPCPSMLPFNASNNNEKSPKTSIHMKLEDRMKIALSTIAKLTTDPQLCCRDVFKMDFRDVNKIIKRLPVSEETKKEIKMCIAKIRKRINDCTTIKKRKETNESIPKANEFLYHYIYLSDDLSDDIRKQFFCY